MINQSYLAVLYYNLFYDYKKYDIDKMRDLRNAHKAFANNKNIDSTTLRNAISMYNELLAEAMDCLYDKKCKKLP